MLEEYRKKRHFEKTPEPDAGSSAPAEDALRFVVQKHAASHLHYDFRLEAGGALKSWAVPKGPSLNPADKHLAVMVEDHPLGYASFEGVIPEGEYGGGQVIVWDEGTYQPKGTTTKNEAEKAVEEGLREGNLHFTLFGHKLHGEFVLTRMHGRPEKDWLLMKVHDPFASTANVLEQEDSVVSGRSIEDVKRGVGPDLRKSPKTLEPTTAEDDNSPTDYRPMLAAEADAPFDDPKWQFELKLDGVRAIAIGHGGHTKLESRNGNAIGENLKSIVAALKQVEPADFVLDGELVFFDEEGKPSFQQLMKRVRPGSPGTGHLEKRPGRVEYCVFDVLRLGERDLRSQPLSERRKELESLNLKDPIRVLDAFPEHGELLYEKAMEMGFEGVMAKLLSSKYEEGRRSRAWLKLKSHKSEEFIVGGFTEGKGSRERAFGALLLGQKDSQGNLCYVGKVGGGFGDSDLEEILPLLKRLKTSKSPFQGDVDVAHGIQWIKPDLVVEVKYMTRTEDGNLRFPVFMRIRPDREAASVGSKQREPEESQPDGEGNMSETLSQLDALGESGSLHLGDHELRLSHLEKELWPKTPHTEAVTKRDLLRYLIGVSAEMLPYLKDRPLAFVRHPDGIDCPGFFQKHPIPGTPDYVSRVPIWSDQSSGVSDWIMCNDLATLGWLAQVGTIEIHAWYSRAAAGSKPELPTDFKTHDKLEQSALNFPDFMVLDLDPNIEGAAKKLGPLRAFDREAWDRTVKIALALREILESIGLKVWLKSSGKTGLHLYVPIERRYDYSEVKAVAETLGQQVAAQHPEDATMVWSVKNRPNAVFIDHNQNVRGKTLAAPFSPRVAAGGTVSFPIEWDRLKNFDPTQVTIRTALQRLAEWGNPWRDILDHPQRLPI